MKKIWVFQLITGLRWPSIATSNIWCHFRHTKEQRFHWESKLPPYNLYRSAPFWSALFQFNNWTVSRGRTATITFICQFTVFTPLIYSLILILIPIIILWDKCYYIHFYRGQCWSWKALSASTKVVWLISDRARSLTLKPPAFHLYHPITTVKFNLGIEDLVIHVNTLQTLEGPLCEIMDRC